MPEKKKKPAKKSFADAFKTSGAFNVELFNHDNLLMSDAKGYVSTGNLILDASLGTPGIPLGKIIEVNGKPHAGKTTLTYQIAREAQKMGGYAAVYDIESSMNSKYLATLGVEDDKLIRMQPTDGEQWTVETVFSSIEKACKQLSKDFPDVPGIVIVDSLGAMKDKDSADKGIESEKNKPGATAKAMANVLRHLPPVISGTMISVIVINHSYQTIGPFSSSKNYGGDALGYHKQLGLYLRTKGAINSANPEVGQKVEVRIDKNKTAATSYRKIELGLVRNAGFDNYYSAFLALQPDYIQVGGSGRTKIVDEVFGEMPFTKKFEGLKSLCEDNPELKERVLDKLKEKAAALING